MAKARLDVEVPEELLNLLAESKLALKSREEQVRTALAIHLFLVGEISLGRAAELSAEPLHNFRHLLGKLGLPQVMYGREEYEQDLRTTEVLERKLKRH